VKAAARRFLRILKIETPLRVVLAGKFDWRDLCALGIGGWGSAVQLFFYFCFKFWKMGVSCAVGRIVVVRAVLYTTSSGTHRVVHS
jgi:hypothetical protein